jgi:hypothetical protein
LTLATVMTNWVELVSSIYCACRVDVRRAALDVPGKSIVTETDAVLRFEPGLFVGLGLGTGSGPLPLPPQAFNKIAAAIAKGAAKRPTRCVTKTSTIAHARADPRPAGPTHNYRRLGYAVVAH